MGCVFCVAADEVTAQLRILLAAARKVYLSRGFRLVEEESQRSFGVDLIGQVYELWAVGRGLGGPRAYAGCRLRIARTAR